MVSGPVEPPLQFQHPTGLPHDATKKVTADSANGGYAIWTAEAQDIGEISAQLVDTPGPRPIRETYAGWMEYIRSKDPRAVGELGTHEYFISVLRDGGTFSTRPVILHANRQVHDGRHRLYAAYEFAHDKANFTIEVYWNRRA